MSRTAKPQTAPPRSAGSDEHKLTLLDIGRRIFGKPAFEEHVTAVFADLITDGGFTNIVRHPFSSSHCRLLAPQRFALDLWTDERTQAMGGLLIDLEGKQTVQGGESLCALIDLIRLRNVDPSSVSAPAGRNLQHAIQAVHVALKQSVPELFAGDDQTVRALILRAGGGEQTSAAETW